MNFQLLEKVVAPEQDNAFVVILGIGTVFIGLVCIVILCKLIGLFCGSAKKEEAVKIANTPSKSNEPIQNRQEIVAAVSAVIAEELGTDVSAIKILSFKKI